MASLPAASSIDDTRPRASRRRRRSGCRGPAPRRDSRGRRRRGHRPRSGETALAGSKPTQPRSSTSASAQAWPASCPSGRSAAVEVAADVAGRDAEVAGGGDEDVGEILADAVAVVRRPRWRWCRCRWRRRRSAAGRGCRASGRAGGRGGRARLSRRCPRRRRGWPRRSAVRAVSRRKTSGGKRSTWPLTTPLRVAGLDLAFGGDDQAVERALDGEAVDDVAEGVGGRCRGGSRGRRRSAS